MRTGPHDYGPRDEAFFTLSVSATLTTSVPT